MAMKPSGQFAGRWMPFVLASPQLVIVLVFFYLPVAQALSWSFTVERPFGGSLGFVGLDNYIRLFSDPDFGRAAWATLVFTVGGCGTALAIALVLAGFADRPLRGKTLIANLLIWPMAVAPAVLGVVLRLFANPNVGPLSGLNAIWPGLWAPGLDGGDALVLVTMAFAWTLVPFNFIVLLAALQSVPETYLQAAAMDGAGPVRRFRDIQLPMIAPFILFVVVMNSIEAITGSFGLINTLTEGGPAGATTTLVYKVYADGFVGLDLSGSATLTVVIVTIVVALTALKFRFAERRSGEG